MHLYTFTNKIRSHEKGYPVFPCLSSFNTGLKIVSLRAIAFCLLLFVGRWWGVPNSSAKKQHKGMTDHWGQPKGKEKTILAGFSSFSLRKEMPSLVVHAHTPRPRYWYQMDTHSNGGGPSAPTNYYPRLQ